SCPRRCSGGSTPATWTPPRVNSTAGTSRPRSPPAAPPSASSSGARRRWAGSRGRRELPARPAAGSAALVAGDRRRDGRRRGADGAGAGIAHVRGDRARRVAGAERDRPVLVSLRVQAGGRRPARRQGGGPGGRAASAAEGGGAERRAGDPA